MRRVGKARRHHLIRILPKPNLTPFMPMEMQVAEIEIDGRRAQEAAAQEERLIQRLRALSPVAIAVSGGVDSLTLATLAHRVLQGASAMFHAVSPAVPEEATGRV